MAIRAIVFDIGGILEVSPSGGEPALLYSRFMKTWETRLGLDAGVLLALLDQKRDAGIIGACTEHEWVEHLRAGTRTDDATLDEMLDAFWDIYLGAPNDELTTWFRARRASYRTALLSNSFVGAREREERRYAFSSLVELIVYSHEAGVRKPDRRIYELTLERLGLAPNEMLFLDDLGENVEAARSLGIHAVRFQNNGQAIPAMEEILAAHGGPRARLRDL